MVMRRVAAYLDDVVADGGGTRVSEVLEGRDGSLTLTPVTS